MKLSIKVKKYIENVQLKVSLSIYPITQISRDTNLSRYKIENITSLLDAETIDLYLIMEGNHRESIRGTNNGNR